jgi:anti-sigma factor RsiW
MCPDRRLLSVYADGELDSPWKLKVEAHLASCRKCSALYESYISLSGALSLLDTEKEKAVLSRMRLMRPDRLRGIGADTARIRDSRDLPFWRRPLVVPFPIATAAALGLCLAAVLVLSGKIPSGNRDYGTSSIARTVISAQPATFQALVQSIDSQGGDSAMTIILPDETSLQGSGDPVLMTASTAAGGNR